MKHFSVNRNRSKASVIKTAKANAPLVFLSACLLLSACAGSGGAVSHFRPDSETQPAPSPVGSRQPPSETDYLEPVLVPIPRGERTTSVVSPPLNVFRPLVLIPRQDEPYPIPYGPPVLIPRQDEPYPIPYGPPVLISRSEPFPVPGSLPSPLPVPDYIPNARVSEHCHNLFTISNPVSGTTYNNDPGITDPCNRARIPGLTRLRSAVAANVAAKLSAGITPQKYGVILDFESGSHGTDVLDTAEIAAPPELLDFVGVGQFKHLTVAAFKNLNPDSYGGNTIVNLSQGNLFAASEAEAGCGRLDPDGVDFCNFLTPEDVSSANALTVVSASNYGPDAVASAERIYSNCINRGGTDSDCRRINEDAVHFIDGKIVINPASASRLETVPEQPGHNLDALRAIHEQTGSILIVAGLQANSSYPLTDENGLHTGYRTALGQSGGGPAIHGDSNRCGMAMNYCVAAPYTIYRGVRVETVTPILGGARYSFSFTPSIRGTSFSAPLVTGTLINLRYAWPHLTNRQLVRLACVTAEDLGASGIDAVYGCGQFSVSAIWKPTGELVDDPAASFTLAVSAGGLTVSGGTFSEPVTVTGYENNEFKRDYEVAVAASDSGTSVRIDPAVSWNSLNSILRFRKDGANSLPLANGRGSATHLFKDTFLFLKGAENSYGALGLSHKSGFSIAFERETDSFFGSVGSGSYKFGDTNKIVASFDRDFQIGRTYNAGLKLAAAYGKMEPDISLVKSASGTAQTAQVSIGRKKNNFETRLEMSYSTGLKGEISVQNTNYKLRPRSEKGVVIRMRLAI